MLAEHLVGYRTVPHLQSYPQHPSLWRPQPLQPHPHPHAHHHQQLQPNAAAFGVLFGVSDRSHFLHHYQQQQRPPSSSAAYSPRSSIDADVSKHAEIAFPRTVERSAPGTAPRPEGRRSCPPPNHLYIPPNQRGKNFPSSSSLTNGHSPGPMPDPLESEPVQSSSAEPKVQSPALRAEEENSFSANGQSECEDQSEESAVYISDRLAQIPLAPNPPAPLHHFRPYKSFPVEGEKYKSFTLTQAQLSYINPPQQPQQQQPQSEQQEQQPKHQHDEEEDEASATTDGENDAASQADGNLPPPRSTREVSKRRFPFVYGSLGGCSLSKNIWGRRATKALKSLHQHFTGEAPLAPSAVAHRLSLLTPPPLVDDVSAFDPAKILDDNERIKWLKEVQRKRNRWKKVIRREKEKIVSYYKANGGNVDGCFIDIIQQQQKQQQVAFSYFVYPLFTFPPPSEPTTTTTTTQHPQQPEVPTLSLCGSSSSAAFSSSPLSPRRESENEEEEKEQDEDEQPTTTTSYNYSHTLHNNNHNNNNNNHNHNNEERWCQGQPGKASPIPSSDSEGEEHHVGSLSEEMTDGTQDGQDYCRWTAHLAGK